jgi:hypothetical protein
MKNLIKNKSFIFGCLLGLLIVGLLNRFTADFSQVNEWCNYRELSGFPFLQFEKCEGNISYSRRYLVGTLGNILFAVFFSFGIGIVCESVWSKIVLRNLR